MPLIIVLMVHMRMTIRTTLGLERGLHLDNLPAQPNDHRAEHMVRQKPQACFANLQRNMSITDVIRNSGELLGVRGAHFKKRFKLSLDRDDPTIVEL
jgi:hypothetical protein